MFVVDDILISDAVLGAHFACNLGACHGACCVQGDSGAPLEPEERAVLEAALPRVRSYLRPEALRVIEDEGVWEASPGKHDDYATTCVAGAECVFVTYEGPVAKCALQKAHLAGRIDFVKPISCHLYPLRIEQVGGHTVINYEQIDLCAPARRHGQRHGTLLVDLLQAPLERRFGAAWYEKFRRACDERLRVLEAA